MHHALLRLILFAKVRIMTRVENVVLPMRLDYRTGEYIKILLVFSSAGQHHPVLGKVQKIVGTDLVPRSSFTIVLGVSPVMQVEQVESSIFVEWDEIRSPRAHWLIKQARHNEPPVDLVCSRYTDLTIAQPVQSVNNSLISCGY